jgi:hypothetical protein
LNRRETEAGVQKAAKYLLFLYPVPGVPPAAADFLANLLARPLGRNRGRRFVQTEVWTWQGTLQRKE